MTSLSDEIKKIAPIRELRKLLEKDPRNFQELKLHTEKYMIKINPYIAEKTNIFVDAGLDKTHDKSILDIGAGMGLFSWICKIKDHHCDSTYFDKFEFYEDSWKLFNIPQPYFLEIKRDEAWNLPTDKKYDVITSIRTVFDRYPESWNYNNWVYFLREGERYLNDDGLIIIKTNRIRNGHGIDGDFDHDTKERLSPYFLQGYNSRTFRLTKMQIADLR